MPRRHTQLWDHFEKCVEGEKMAICNYCKKTLSYKGSTSNLKTHLKLKHLSVYSNLMHGTVGESGYGEGILRTVVTDGSRNVVGDGSVPGGSGVCGNTGEGGGTDNGGGGNIGVAGVGISSANEPANKVQRMMSSYLPKKLRPGDKKIIDKCLIKLIAYDCQPFSIVDDLGFREFVRALNPSYELPSRKTISSSMLPAFYEERRQYFKNFVKENAESVCLTADCWSSRTLDQYMGVTAHFFSNELEMKSILLQCDLLDGSHTGARIAQELEAIGEAWGISQKIFFIVSDNAANMLRACTLLNWGHFGCYEHKLNLVVQDALNTNKDTLEKVTKTVTFFKKSCQAKEKLLKYQFNNLNIQQPKTVVKAVPNRWNSTFLMLERFHVLKEALQATIATLNVSLPVIPNEEWECIEQMCWVLKPFYEVSNVMSGENYLTASTALVLSSSLMSICDNLSGRNLYPPVLDMLCKLKEGLVQRLGDIHQNTAIVMCTLLDPRYKDVAFSDDLALTNTKRHLLTLMQNLQTDDDLSATASENEEIGSQNLSIWGEFDMKIKRSTAPKTATTKAMEELEMFLKETVISRTACPLTWWRTHKYIYPVFYQIFKTRCNIMVTSVPCERVFSKAGYIINDRRTRLTTAKVAQIMFLNINKI